MAFVPPARHLLRAKDLADARYFEPLEVSDLARAAGLSCAHFSREFRRAFGESPHAYLLTRRLERAAALLRSTDRPVADICLSVGRTGQPAFAISLMPIPGPPVMDPETAEQVRALMAKGFAGTVFLTTDDVQASYEELKGRGVEFTEPPEERPYGIDSGFRDPSGNALRLTQVRDLASL